MKKIIPVLCLIGSLLGFGMAITALTLLIFCSADPSLIAVTVFTIPLLVTATVTTGLTAFVNFMFMRDRLCLVGFIVGLVGLLCTVVGYIVLFTV